MDKKYHIDQPDPVFDLLTSSAPNIRMQYDAYIREYYQDNQERLLFFDMMEISAIVVRLFQQNQSNDLKSFFEKVEIILNDADAETTHLMLSGLIEGIQQICQYQNVDMRHEFDQWLLPVTKKHWDELMGLFEHE